MDYKKLLNYLVIGLTFDFILIKIFITFPVHCIALFIHANVLNIVTNLYRNFRSRQMGYAIRKSIDHKFINLLFAINTIFPITNTIISTKNYFNAFKDDEEFINNSHDKLVPFKEAINEHDPQEKVCFFYPHEEMYYNDITEKEYKLSKKMLEVNDYVDYIIMNQNLSNENKKELLKLFRTKILLNQNIRIDKKIKKLIKH